MWDADVCQCCFSTRPSAVPGTKPQGQAGTRPTCHLAGARAASEAQPSPGAGCSVLSAPWETHSTSPALSLLWDFALGCPLSGLYKHTGGLLGMGSVLCGPGSRRQSRCAQESLGQ